MNGALKVFDKVSGFVSSGAGFIAGVALLAMVFIASYEVIMRKFFNAPTYWSIELITIMVVWFAFMTLGLVQRRGRHIHVDILVGSLSPRTRTIFSLATLTITLVCVILLGYYSWGSFARSLAIGETSGTIWNTPLAMMKFALPFGCIVLGVELVFQIFSSGYSLASESLKKSDGWRDNPLILIPIFLTLLGVSIWLLSVVPVAGLILMLMTLLFAGVPIFASLILVGMAGLFLNFGGSLALTQVPSVIYATVGQFGIAALPLFMVAGYLLEKGGVGEDIYDLFSKFVGHWPGGLAITTILACAFFAAICMSSVAVAATMCLLALPALKRRKYSDTLSYGVIGAGATLGIMIPPGGTMILYALVTGESMGQVMIAGILPGLMIVIMFSIYSVIKCQRTGAYEKEQVWSWKDRWDSLKRASWGILTPVIIIVGIFTGIFTVLESAAIAALYSLVMVLARRRIKFRDLPTVLSECGIMASMILIIMAGALTMGRFMTLLRVPQTVMDAVIAANLPDWGVMAAIMLLLIVLGLFLECASVMMITLPVLYPLVTGLGFSGVWFAVMMTLNMEMALITPPVGLNLYVIQGISGAKLSSVLKGVLPFFIIMALGLVILYFFPQISLVLPNMMAS